MKNKDLVPLIKKIKKREAGAFDSLYNSLWDTIFYIAFCYLDDVENAKDVTQEAFIIIYNKINELKEPQAFNQWMNRIVMNLCYHYQKKQQKEIYYDIEELYEAPVEENTDFLPIEFLDNKELRESVINSISKLPEKLKSVVIMYYFEQMPIKEIAEVLYITNNTVYERLIKSRKVLKDELLGDKSYVIKTSNSLPILTLILKENSKIMCSEGLKLEVYNSVKNSKLLKSTKTNQVLSLLSSKIIISMGVTLAVGGGYYILQQPNSKEVENVPVEKIELSDLELFVGVDNAKLIKSWKIASTNNNDDMFNEIINDNHFKSIFSENYPDITTMYLLYQKTMDTKTLLLCERYNAYTKEWQVVYQIIDNNDDIPTNDNIRTWFEEIEKKEK